jgi:anti-anti-sigma factor
LLAPSGDLDFATAAEAHKRLLGLRLEPGGELVLDLRAVTFMDSTGIRLLLQANEYALRHGATLVLVRGPEPVMRVLRLVGLEDQLEIADEF